MISTETPLFNIKSDMLDYVLDSMRDLTDTLCQYAVCQYKRKFKSIEPYERDWIRLHTEREFYSAFERFTKPSDILIDFNKSGTVNDIISITCVIRRDEQNYIFNSHIVWKDFRRNNVYFEFLIKTGLAKSNRTKMFDSYNTKIKKISDIRILENKIHFSEVNINRIRINILLNKMKSENDIIKSQKPTWHYIRSLNWKDAIREGYDLTYEDENEFNIIKERAKVNALSNFNKYNILKPDEKIDKLKNELKLLKKEMNVLKKRNK